MTALRLFLKIEMMTVTGINCMMKRFVICTPYNILFGLSEQVD
jgi:hypothetical protein